MMWAEEQKRKAQAELLRVIQGASTKMCEIWIRTYNNALYQSYVARASVYDLKLQPLTEICQGLGYSQAEVVTASLTQYAYPLCNNWVYTGRIGVTLADAQTLVPTQEATSSSLANALSAASLTTVPNTCWQRAVLYWPNVGTAYARNVIACQQLCRATQRCAFFTFWPGEYDVCRMADASQQPVATYGDVFSGPASCNPVGTGSSLFCICFILSCKTSSCWFLI
jgi:hypothetical protein